MTRASEHQILNWLVAGNVVPPAMLDNLLCKFSKDQSKSKVRAATAQTEQKSAEIYTGRKAPEEETLRTAIVNYTADRAAIDSFLRTGAPAASPPLLHKWSAAFAVIRFTATNRFGGSTTAYRPVRLAFPSRTPPLRPLERLV